METRLLEYFLAVAEELSFTRAAARSHVVQSTISAGVRALEAELGVELFERAGRRVALTPAGEALVPPARELIDTVDGLHRAVTGDVRGQLRVGIFANLDLLDMPAALAEFRTRHPHVDLQLGASPTGSTGLAEDVRRGRVDIAFMGLPATDLAGLETTPLFHATVTAILPRGHPLAARSSVRLADVADEPFVDTASGFANRVVVERALAAQRLARRVATEVASVSDIVPFVAAGFGVALAPLAIVTLDERVVAVPVTPRLDWPLSLVTRPRPSAAAVALRDLISSRFADRAAARPPALRSRHG
ncbi:LysR family transcriptional regulator [Galbitalea sp. SE-J8]|uniref:LysR family transcriptional regulator n=1 Tax=Galbitalea sp. SE-J8 TaxID=3054952 RepID=UPI00259CFC83|nr:LysR family transcriptional regulator [Galbitalea sp. SE-J8]MDM4762586.1 LysR family transcriptional regulator [Galbitalea sp. SE-J8]